MSATTHHPLFREVHHLGYIVDDLTTAVERYSRLTGAGPFFVTENVRLSEVTTGSGEPATYAHSSAIGQLGDIAIEFMTVHGASPRTLDAALTSFTVPALHHVAWVVDEWEGVVSELEAAGAPSYMKASFGAMRTSYHDASAVVGHHLEVHKNNPDLVAFFAMIREASAGWDGTRLLRRLDG